MERLEDTRKVWKINWKEKWRKNWKRKTRERTWIAGGKMEERADWREGMEGRLERK